MGKNTLERKDYIMDKLVVPIEIEFELRCRGLSVVANSWAKYPFLIVCIIYAIKTCDWEWKGAEFL